MGRHLIPFLLVACSVGCAAPVGENPGQRPEDLLGDGDPVAAVDLRLREAAPLIERMDAEDDAGRQARERVEDLAREVAIILGSPAFDPWPMTRARMRARVLFLADADGERRRLTHAECLALLNKLQAKMARVEDGE